MMTRQYTYLDDCKYGKFLVPPDDIYVGRALEKCGEYSEHELDLLFQILLAWGDQPTQIVIAGANIGALLVPLAKRCASMVAFEPQRLMYQLAVANVALNNLINVRLYWAGLGAQRGLLSVPVLDPFVEQNFGAFELDAPRGDVQGWMDRVPVWKLDDIPGLHPQLVTIDVEGMELQVLQGAAALIRRCRPVIFFEADRDTKKKELYQYMRSFDYQLYSCITPLFNAKNYRGSSEDIFNGAGAHNVLGLPSEHPIHMPEGILITEHM